MKSSDIASFIVNWLESYCSKANSEGFILGVSGGVDSAVTSTLCAQTGKKVILINLPIRQEKSQFKRATDHITSLKERFPNVESLTIDLSSSFDQLENDFPNSTSANELAMANTRARLRMLTLYAVGQTNNCLVVGTGNKVEDFGVGFFTKYGDGGVDISPIADLTKTEVWELAKTVGVNQEIIDAKPTDGLWGTDRVTTIPRHVQQI